jgi:hypothetical protein
MAENLEPGVAAIGVRLLDDAYMAWAAAESESSRALRTWRDRGPRGHDAYYTYLAALDREEAAARDLQRLWALTEPCRDELTGHQEQLGRA